MAATRNKKGYLLSRDLAKKVEAFFKRRERKATLRRRSAPTTGTGGPLFF